MQNIDVVSMICDSLDELYPEADNIPKKDLIAFVKDRPGHDQRYAIDFNKLETELGWVPAESFKTGIKKTIKWYVDNTDWTNRIKSGEYMSWIKQQYDM